MVPPLLFSQLVLLALVWLCLRLHGTEPSDPATCPPTSAPTPPGPQPHRESQEYRPCTRPLPPPACAAMAALVSAPSPAAPLASSSAATSPCPGGYRVSSRGAYASGCWHCTWYLALCHLYDDGAMEPHATSAGSPEIVVVHLPRAQMQILDTWDVSGLAATGSHDVVVEDVFVPDAFVWPLRPQAPRGPHFSDPLYRFPFLGFFSWPMAAVALGIAQRALDEITAVALAKTPRLGTGTLHEQPLFQMQLAHAVAHVRSARAWLHEVITMVWEQTVGGAAVSVEDRAAFQLAATNATHSAAAVDLAYTAGEGVPTIGAAPCSASCATSMP